MLRLILSNLVLLNSSLLLLSYPAYVQFLSLNLSTFLDFLLVGEDEELLWHAYLFDALHVHTGAERTDATLMTAHPQHLLLLVLTASVMVRVAPVATSVVMMLPSAVLSIAMVMASAAMVREVRGLTYARVLFRQQVVELDVERRHRAQLLKHLC